MPCFVEIPGKIAFFCFGGKLMWTESGEEGAWRRFGGEGEEEIVIKIWETNTYFTKTE